MDRGQSGIEKEEARKLQGELDRYRLAIWKSPAASLFERIDPFTIATQILHVNLEQPEEIPSTRNYFPGGNLPSRTGAYLDRAEKKIAVARRFRLPVRRFTLAHMLGHWQLHGSVLRFEDGPLIAGDLPDSSRDRLEREASRFAEELLMPVDLVRKHFRQCLEVETLRNEPIGEALAERLGRGTDRRVTVTELIASGRGHVALLAAACIPVGQPRLSLADLFQVNVLAMALRLQRLELV